MEKRFIIAIVLSFCVLYFWSLSTYKAHPPVLPITESSVSQVKSSENLDVEPAKTPFVQDKAPVDVSAILTTSKLGKLSFVLSEVGGRIKSITLDDYQVTLPLSSFGDLSAFDSQKFTLIENNAQTISVKAVVGDFEITKTISRVDDYAFNLESIIKNRSRMSNLVKVNPIAMRLEMSSLDKKEAQDQALYEYLANYDGLKFLRKNNAFQFTSKDAVGAVGKVEWMGFRNRYYCALVHPEFETKGFSLSVASSSELGMEFKADDVSLGSGEEIRMKSLVYVGPEEISYLKKYGVGFEKAKRYYRFSIFDAAAKAIHFLMISLHKIFPNWGVCIILTGMIVYLSMYPLTLSSMTSMKKMQQVQPLVAALKEKHKNNPQKMNAEMMAIYKDNKINPLAGCLPMLLQMPVFIGLYQVLWRSVDLKGASFLWIKDLSEPDHLFKLPFSLPFGVEYFNILPLLMMIVMFFQQKLSSKAMVITDEAQATQQKMMLFMMPLMLGFVFYNFASGLTLYFTMFYSFSALTQWKMQQPKKGA